MVSRAGKRSRCGRSGHAYESRNSDAGAGGIQTSPSASVQQTRAAAIPPWHPPTCHLSLWILLASSVQSTPATRHPNLDGITCYSIHNTTNSSLAIEVERKGTAATATGTLEPKLLSARPSPSMDAAAAAAPPLSISVPHRQLLAVAVPESSVRPVLQPRLELGPGLCHFWAARSFGTARAEIF